MSATILKLFMMWANCIFFFVSYSVLHLRRSRTKKQVQQKVKMCSKESAYTIRRSSITQCWIKKTRKKEQCSLLTFAIFYGDCSTNSNSTIDLYLYLPHTEIQKCTKYMQLINTRTMMAQEPFSAKYIYYWSTKHSKKKKCIKCGWLRHAQA